MKTIPLLLVAALVAGGCTAADPTASTAAAEPQGAQGVQNFLQDERYKAAVEEEMRRMAEEEATLEPAVWMGKTGLPEDIEWEVPRYLRRELGQALQETGSLRAADLVYAGSFSEPSAQVHYWRLPAEYSTQPTFAYVTVVDDEFSFGWSDRTPPGR